MKVMKGGYFMKKILIIISLALVFIVGFKEKEEEIIIPDQAIRFRVIAASNSKKDQAIKEKVKDALQKDITTLLKESTSISQTREILKTNTKRFDTIITKTLLDNKASDLYKIHYGLNYFPEKKYKGITYQEGYYESLVITLGSGIGDNWWCVLFPPLCLLEAQETNKEEVEYKSFVKEMIQKYFTKDTSKTKISE